MTLRGARPGWVSRQSAQPGPWSPENELTASAALGQRRRLSWAPLSGRRWSGLLSLRAWTRDPRTSGMRPQHAWLSLDPTEGTLNQGPCGKQPHKTLLLK